MFGQVPAKWGKRSSLCRLMYRNHTLLVAQAWYSVANSVVVPGTCASPLGAGMHSIFLHLLIGVGRVGLGCHFFSASNSAGRVVYENTIVRFAYWQDRAERHLHCPCEGGNQERDALHFRIYIHAPACGYTCMFKHSCTTPPRTVLQSSVLTIPARGFDD